MLLAAGLSAAVLRALVDANTADTQPVADRQASALLWAAKAITMGQRIDDQRLTAVIQALATLARRPVPVRAPARGGGFLAAYYRDNIRWRCARALASLRVPAVLRTNRDDALRTLPLEADQQVIAHALTVLSDAAFDEAVELHSAECAAVSAMLVLPIPERQSQETTAESSTAGVRRAGPWIGHVNAAEQAIRYLDQFDPGTAEEIHRIGQQTSVGQYRRILALLARKGHSFLDSSLPHNLWAGVPGERDAFKSAKDRLYVAASSVAEPGVLTLAERWRLPELCRLAEVIELAEIAVGDVPRIKQTDLAFMTRWVRAVAHAAGLELRALAAQAANVLSQDPVEKDRLWNLLITAPSSTEPRIDTAHLTGEDIDCLILAVSEPSSLIADTAMRLLEQTHNHQVGVRVEQRLQLMPKRRKANAAILVCLHSSDPQAKIEKFFAEDDRLCRAGAAFALRALPPTHPAKRLIDLAIAHEDMSVRLAAGASDEIAKAAQYWSCMVCGEANSISVERCGHCEGPRPSPENWTE